MTYDELKTLHRQSIYNEQSLKLADKRGCFYCLEIFEPSAIMQWMDESHGHQNGRTAVCPHCGIDAVLAHGAECHVTVGLLEAMQEAFYSDKARRA